MATKTRIPFNKHFTREHFARHASYKLDARRATPLVAKGVRSQSKRREAPEKKNTKQQERTTHLELAVEFLAVVVEHGQVQRAKVRVKIAVDELVVDAEVVRVRRRLGPHRRRQRRKVQPIYRRRNQNNFKSLHRPTRPLSTSETESFFVVSSIWRRAAPPNRTDFARKVQITDLVLLSLLYIYATQVPPGNSFCGFEVWPGGPGDDLSRWSVKHWSISLSRLFTRVLQLIRRVHLSCGIISPSRGKHQLTESGGLDRADWDRKDLWLDRCEDGRGLPLTNSAAWTRMSSLWRWASILDWGRDPVLPHDRLAGGGCGALDRAGCSDKERPSALRPQRPPRGLPPPVGRPVLMGVASSDSDAVQGWTGPSRLTRLLPRDAVWPGFAGRPSAVELDFATNPNWHLSWHDLVLFWWLVVWKTWSGWQRQAAEARFSLTAINCFFFPLASWLRSVVYTEWAPSL